MTLTPSVWPLRNKTEYTLPAEFPVVVVEKLFVTGGYISGTRTNQAEVIDVDGQEGTVTTLPPMQETREDHTLAAAGSLLFAFGGWIKRGSNMS